MHKLKCFQVFRKGILVPNICIGFVSIVVQYSSVLTYNFHTKCPPHPTDRDHRDDHYDDNNSIQVALFEFKLQIQCSNKLNVINHKYPVPRELHISIQFRVKV